MSPWECLNNSITPNILVMGRAAFMRVPVSEANDLKFLLCRCDETSNASSLGNNEIKPMKQLGLNSALKNRTTNDPRQANLIKQRTAADVGMVHGFIWTKTSRAQVLIFNLDSLTPKKKVAPLLIFKLNFNRPPRCCYQRIVLAESPNPNDRARRPAGFNIASYHSRSCTYYHHCLENRTTIICGVAKQTHSKFLLCDF